jgi:hypothetical protein
VEGTEDTAFEDGSLGLATSYMAILPLLFIAVRKVMKGLSPSPVWEDDFHLRSHYLVQLNPKPHPII